MAKDRQEEIHEGKRKRNKREDHAEEKLGRGSKNKKSLASGRITSSSTPATGTNYES